ncbi:AbrB/MazE/SpoVT family DNA-binding domain-containing protein [Galbitalea sp. SE-J8]|uniref:AbrB/MazE/SpoVT family DNA-binding domain-containing protein n=1 Tax=Galbitalea sp. SE-J8 TaxID=3054952 RepID=UPI00259CBE6D|nr:AbrB/MazE/SpoVT family DNA-binding domain-containing protein [Galbitalea sp. SE-J8]MDM4761463.1 AbrB/MazE/SpoVT family DNA-binding domain-containing protein [Galbitalea sp. SE-J8]
MRTTIDKAGRIVVPKSLRDELGLTEGPVEIVVANAELRVVPLASDELVERDGLLTLPPGGYVDDEQVRKLRLGDQR